MSPSEAPVLLTHVCRRWRDAAHSFAPLWASLKFELCLPDPECTDLDVDLHQLTNWFRRAKGTPLALQLSFITPVYNRILEIERLTGRRAVDQETYDRLTGESDDLHDLNFPVPVTGLVHPLLSEPIRRTLTNLTLCNIRLLDLQPLSRGSFPMLERLALGSLPHDPSELALPLDAFVESHQLRYVAVDSLPTGDHIKLPWNQLTHFAEFHYDARDALSSHVNLLRNAASLRHLHVNLDVLHPSREDAISRQGVGSSRSTTLTPFRHVRKLSLHCFGWGGNLTISPNFWREHDFPSLEALQINWATLDLGTGSGAEIFTRRVQVWSRLRHLSLQDMREIPEETMKVLLGAMPNLTTLDLEPANLSTLVVSSDQTATHLVPRLQHLIIQYTDDDLNNENTERALQAVKSRMDAQRQGLNQGEGLRKVTIYAYDTASDPKILHLVGEMEMQEVNGVRLEVEARERRIDFDLGWQSWNEMDEELSSWPGLDQVAGTDEF